MVLRWGKDHHKGLKRRQVLDNFSRQRTDEKRQGDGTDMFSHFCREKNDTGDYYSHQEITDHVLFLLFAAHDTTTSALTMAMQLLAAHQDWQTELRDTIGRIETDIPTFDQLGRNIPLLGYTFKEVLRLYPPVPNLIRRTIKPCEIGGYEVPAHTMVGTSISANHHLPEYWHEPFKFDPMRFSESRAEHKQRKFCGRRSVAAVINALACILPICYSSVCCLIYSRHIASNLQTQSKRPGKSCTYRLHGLRTIPRWFSSRNVKHHAYLRLLSAVRRYPAGDRRCHRSGRDPDHSGASEATRAT